MGGDLEIVEEMTIMRPCSIFDRSDRWPNNEQGPRLQTKLTTWLVTEHLNGTLLVSRRLSSNKAGLGWATARINFPPVMHSWAERVADREHGQIASHVRG